MDAQQDVTMFPESKKPTPGSNQACPTRMGGLLCNVQVAIVLSLIAIGGVTYIYFSRENTNQPEPVDVQNVPVQPSKLKGHQSGKIWGRFKLNQKYFDDTKRENIRWIPVTHANNGIIPDPNEPCVIVPENGTYGIFSVLTFAVERNDPVKRLTHFLRLYKYQEGEQHFQRKVFAVPVSENRNDPEIIPSTLISFSSLKANGSICPDTMNKENVFISSLDNTINIFKV
ncbi:uncharacterized protein LOC132716780 [Ruditapes philippinarum]|uniref:uncharacterized protein LOC132716780 n=1 Tax=Ruditapes philippinarum TaxID=129788 RepID=UPI00295AF051|nr:uncharacterized protein LOC132716780 [Ruditapes philippinarum]